jgi:pimeloyl-ACP methyl ester carboxylesterase
MPGLERLMELTLPRSVIASGIRNEYGDPERVTPALIDRYEELTLREGNRHALGVRFAHTDAGTHASRIKTLRLPTLILWGGRDKLLPMAHAQQFQQAITGSQLMIFDDLGHVPHQEDAPRTVAVVKAFLND